MRAVGGRLECAGGSARASESASLMNFTTLKTSDAEMMLRGAKAVLSGDGRYGECQKFCVWADELRKYGSHAQTNTDSNRRNGRH